MPRSRLQLDAERRSQAVRRALGAELHQLRLDAGVALRAVANKAGLSASHLSRIESAGIDASLEAYHAVAAALGADLSIRLYPNTGPAIRDRFQAPIVEALLRSLDARWRAMPEVAVRSPARGVIDLVIVDPAATVVATEVHSRINRVEQQIRWANEKAMSIASSDLWAMLGERRPAVSRLLVLRSTRATRAAVEAHQATFEAAYHADPKVALASLTGRGRGLDRH